MLHNMGLKYKALPVQVKASFWYLLCSILQKGLAFFTVPIFTRLLTTEQYGQFNTFYSWVSIVTVFATINLFYGQYNVGLIKFKDDKKAYISSMQSLSSVITLLLLLVYLAFSEQFNSLMDLPGILVLAMFMQISATSALEFWSINQRFEYKYVKYVVLTLIMSVVNPLAGILAVHYSPDKGVARILSAVIVQVGFCAVLYVHNLSNGRKVFDKKYWKFALSFNIPLIPHYLSQTILSQSDRIMINDMVGKDKAGIYGVAYSAAMLMTIVNTAINNTMVPYTYKKLESREYKDISKVSIYPLIIIAILNFLLILVAPEMIRIIAPSSYYEAIWVIPPVTISMYYIFLYYLFANIEFYFEENKFIMLASIICAAVNLLLNYIFIPLWGYITAGYTTLLSYILYSFAHYIFMKKVINKKIPSQKIYNGPMILAISAVFTMASLAVTLTYQYVFLRYSILLLIIAAVYKFRHKLAAAFNTLRNR